MKQPKYFDRIITINIQDNEGEEKSNVVFKLPEIENPYTYNRLQDTVKEALQPVLGTLVDQFIDSGNEHFHNLLNEYHQNHLEAEDMNTTASRFILFILLDLIAQEG